LSLGIINRVAPQIQVFFISMSVKPMVVTVMTLASLVVLLDVFRSAFERTILHVRQAIYFFS
ncbi:MAG: flagellar biosynthetic protein FliR, partial [Myxococcales bacterium]